MLIQAFPWNQFLAHWWIFFASIVFAAVAISSGVSGALFFSPFFMVVVGLPPAEAIGAGLLTEVFGMSNGLRSYLKQGIIDLSTAKWLILGALPAVVSGALLSNYINPEVLKILFGAGIMFLGALVIKTDSPEDYEQGEHESDFLEERNKEGEETVIETEEGQVFRYETCWRPPGVALAGLGGFVTGLISAGLPEISTTQLITRCRLPPRVAVATSVFVLAIASLAGAAVHALSARIPIYVVAWSIPGVIIGGEMGSHVGRYIPDDKMEEALGVIFLLLGLFILSVQVGL